jgi:uncharacterized protein
MSWLFLAGERVFKLKKPVRLPYLDFSTIERREAACREELRLNRRLAPDVYLGLLPLTRTTGGLTMDGSGRVVDWLVVMRRLDEHLTLEEKIRSDKVDMLELDRLADLLGRFYRRARRPVTTPRAHLVEWRKRLADNYRPLCDTRLPVDRRAVEKVDLALRRFLVDCGDLLAERVARRLIVDGHGDLRPEHVWLGDQIVIIDCLEFNPRLRAIDPFDEIAFLGVECSLLGAPWVGERIAARLARRLHQEVPPDLIRFYRCYRAFLRARLSFVHLLELHPRTPEKWPRLGRQYLALATEEADAILQHLRGRKHVGRT